MNTIVKSSDETEEKVLGKPTIRPAISLHEGGVVL